MESEYVATEGTRNVRATCLIVGMEKVENGGFIVRGVDLNDGDLGDGDLDVNKTG